MNTLLKKESGEALAYITYLKFWLWEYVRRNDVYVKDYCRYQIVSEKIKSRLRDLDRQLPVYFDQFISAIISVSTNYDDYIQADKTLNLQMIKRLSVNSDSITIIGDELLIACINLLHDFYLKHSISYPLAPERGPTSEMIIASAKKKNFNQLIDEWDSIPNYDINNILTLFNIKREEPDVVGSLRKDHVNIKLNFSCKLETLLHEVSLIYHKYHNNNKCLDDVRYKLIKHYLQEYSSVANIKQDYIRRAVGIWLWDYIKKEQCKIIDAIRELDKKLGGSGTGSGAGKRDENKDPNSGKGIGKLGYDPQDWRRIRYHIDNAKQSIINKAVLPIDP